MAWFSNIRKLSNFELSKLADSIVIFGGNMQVGKTYRAFCQAFDLEVADESVHFGQREIVFTVLEKPSQFPAGYGVNQATPRHFLAEDWIYALLAGQAEPSWLMILAFDSIEEIS